MEKFTHLNCELLPLCSAMFSTSDVNCSLRKISSKILCTLFLTSKLGLAQSFSITTDLLTLALLSLTVNEGGFVSCDKGRTSDDRSSRMFEISISCSERSFSTLSLPEARCSEIMLSSDGSSGFAGELWTKEKLISEFYFWLLKNLHSLTQRAFFKDATQKIIFYK